MLHNLLEAEEAKKQKEKQDGALQTSGAPINDESGDTSKEEQDGALQTSGAPINNESSDTSSDSSTPEQDADTDTMNTISSGGTESQDTDSDHNDDYRERIKRFLFLFILFAPISNAFTDAADLGKAISLDKDIHPSLLASGTTIAFLASLGLNAETVLENFEEFCHIIKTRTAPQHWPKISLNKERAIVLTSFFLALYGPWLELVKAHYFISGLPEEYKFANQISSTGWTAFSILASTGAGMTTLLTETTEMFKAMREYAAGQSHPYHNSVSKIVSPLLGFSLGGLASLQTFVQGFVAMEEIFKIKQTPVLATVGTLGFLNMLPNFCFSGLFSINALDDFLGYFQNYKLDLMSKTERLPKRIYLEVDIEKNGLKYEVIGQDKKIKEHFIAAANLATVFKTPQGTIKNPEEIVHSKDNCLPFLVRHAADEESISSEERYAPTRLFSFSLSLGMAVYLSYLNRALNLSFYDSLRKKAELDNSNLPDTYLEILSWVMFAQQVWLATASVSNPVHRVVGGITNKINAGCQRIFQCFATTDEERPLLAEQPSSYYTQGNSNVLFGNTNINTTTTQTVAGLPPQEENDEAYHQQSASACGII